jgi:hypothetical protein
MPRYYKPPLRHDQKHATGAATESNMTKEIQRCAELLRQMYTLDLEICGMADVLECDEPLLEEKKRRANALLTEIRRMTRSWRSNTDASWSIEEEEHIREITRLLDAHPPMRYPP